MKRTLIKLPLYIVASMSLTSCYTDFDPKIDSDPVLCMNSVIEAGKPIKVSLSRTWKWTEGNWPYDLYIRDATVNLIVNDLPVETTNFTDDGPDNEYGNPDIGYFFDFVPQPGDEIHLLADSKELGIAEARVTIPDAVPIERIDSRIVSVDEFVGSYSTSFTFNQIFSVWFTDPEENNNYYRLLMHPVNPQPIGSGIFHEDMYGEIFEQYYASSLFYDRINRENEPLFSEHEGVLDAIFGSSSTWFSLFSDRRISGQTYPLSLQMERGNLIVYNPEEIESLYNVRLCFILYNVSESYYNWFIYDWNRHESVGGALGDIGLSEIILPFSNVSTGAGIVAACTPSVFEISYYDFLKENYVPTHTD